MIRDDEDIYKDTIDIDKKLIRTGKIVYTKDDYFFIQPYEQINPNIIGRDSNVYSNLSYVDKSQRHLIEVGAKVRFKVELGRQGLHSRSVEVIED